MTVLRAKVIVEPEAEPLTPADLYKHLRLTPDEDSDGNQSHFDDPLLEGYIVAAREVCEGYTGVSFAAKTYLASFAEFPAVIELPNPPLVSVISVTYDGAESDTILSSEGYHLDDTGPLAVLRPLGAWPVVAEGAYGYVYFRAGYAVPGDESEPPPLPGWARQAMLLLVGHYYRNREAAEDKALVEIPLGVKDILRRRRVELGMA